MRKCFRGLLTEGTNTSEGLHLRKTQVRGSPNAFSDVSPKTPLALM